MSPIRKAVLATLGAVNITKGEADQIVDGLVARGEIAEENRSETVEHLLKEMENQKNEIERNALAAVQKAINDLGLVDQTEARNIKERLAKIEGTLEDLQKEKKGASGATKALLVAVIALWLFLALMKPYLL